MRVFIARIPIQILFMIAILKITQPQYSHIEPGLPVATHANVWVSLSLVLSLAPRGFSPGTSVFPSR